VAPSVEPKRTDEFSYRECAPEGAAAAPPVLLVHGFPESSRMWEPLMLELARLGRRSLAPDLYCLGDSPDPGPATYERNVEALEHFGEHVFHNEERVLVIVHDWGGFIGLTWACRNAKRVEALVLSDTGFFSDGRWHGVAEMLRSEAGEAAIAAFDRDAFAALLRADGAGFSDEDVDAYWRPFDRGRGREATLEFYRDMDFDKLAPYEGGLAEMAVPTLILWGEDDNFAPLSGARRFNREIPGSDLVVVPGAGHFVFETDPERCLRVVSDFVAALPELPPAGAAPPP
jgi:haloalkane dehalogenase